MAGQFILASGSPRRRTLIASLGIEPDVIKPDVDERRLGGEGPFEYVSRLARLKADTVRDQVSAPATILAADTIVLLAADTIGVDHHGEILGKPADPDDARATLRRLCGRDHIVCTAYSLIALDGESEQRINDDERTVVTMRDYSDAEIDRYVATGDPLDKAGAYAIQNVDFHPAAAISGCYNNVVGLPLCAVKRALAQVNWAGLAASESCDCGAYNGQGGYA